MTLQSNLYDELETLIEHQIKLLGQFDVQLVIVGGVAATLHGSEVPTSDLHVCYARSPENLEKLAEALQSVNAQLRNAPEGLPFILDAETLKKGLNFTLKTDIGSLDLLGEVRGVGYYADVLAGALIFELFGYPFPVIEMTKLISAKRTAGRRKDLAVLPELEAIRERQLREAEEYETKRDDKLH
jgi:hypothetical protein